MGRFDFNPKTVDIGFPLFPKDNYRFKIGEPKTYKFEAKDENSKDQEGISYLLKAVGGPMDGKPYMVRFNLSEDYGEQNAMTFLVCAMGLTPNDEGVKKFREAYGDKDFSVNTDEKTGAGEGWHIAKEREIMIELDIVEIKKGPRQGEKGQGFPKFSPVAA